ncbi:flippase [Methanolobus mangrovi]|uniref:Flippase n=1 Tax=Methanolobus mangrovi TaxID=3072977 RepID=A0AA51YKH7_9EURY|nr:flippase [Methanolobus mangrovi]WMW23239.1 flippase [Methanolobus mangrovi]
MKTAYHIAKNTFFIVFSNVTTKIIAIIITIYLARYLGASDFGKYTFVITYLMMFGFIAGFGLDPVVIKNIAKNTTTAEKMMSNSILIRILTSSASIFLAVAGIHILNYPPDTIYYVQLLSGILLFQGISYLIESFFQSQLKMQFSAISQICSKLVLGILIYYAVQNKWGLSDIFLAYVFSEMLRTFISFIYSKRMLHYKLQFEPRYCMNLIKQSLPFVFGYGLLVVFNRFDILMLSIMKEDIAVGFYSAAFKLTESVLFIPSALSATLMPIMAKQFDTNIEKLKCTYKIGTKYIFMIIFPLIVGGTILGEKIIIYIYTENFSNSIFVFQLLTLTIIFNSLNSIQTSIIVSVNKQQLNNLSISICIILNIMLNLIFIPKYSYVGAGIATFVSAIVLYLFGFYFIYKMLDIQPLNFEIIKLVLSSIFMAIILISTNLSLIGEILMGFTIYMITIVLTKCISMDDYRILK